MTYKDIRMVEECRRIVDRGNSAEVKKDKDGSWIIYEVKKERKEVG
ncbi:MAG: hypothetical protein IJS84_08155 [Spirochaetales bacterium]|nr:hypothetical protein [Spirochaetales bacterium]